MAIGIESIFENGLSQNYSVIISLMKLFPIAFLFMRFINFWAMCSLYLMIELKVPGYLQNILELIYEGANSSTFSLFKA